MDCPFVKVGVAQDPVKRLKQVQTGCPFKINIAFTADFVRAEIASQVEYFTHHELRESQTIGEWFECDVDAAINAITNAQRKVRNRRGELKYYPEVKKQRDLGVGK